MKRVDTLATAIGRGLAAGLAGTAAMTISSTLEARLRRRAPSTAPARATAKVLGIKEFDSDLAQARWNDLSHWGYGTGWGVLRGLLGATGMSQRQATLAHGAAIDLLGREGDRHRRAPPRRIRGRYGRCIRGYHGLTGTPA